MFGRQLRLVRAYPTRGRPTTSTGPTNRSGTASLSAVLRKAYGANASMSAVILPYTGGGTQSPGIEPGITLTDVFSPITATPNQVIENKRFAFGAATYITVNIGVTGVTIKNCEFTGSSDASVVNRGISTNMVHCYYHDSNRGILNVGNEANPFNTGNTVVDYNLFNEINNTGNPSSSAGIETDHFVIGTTAIRFNRLTGTYNGDALSVFMSSYVTLTDNELDVYISEPSGAPFTIGDAIGVGKDPGHDNYAARNTVQQAGPGVPPGIFGSSGNCIFEYNCFKSGIQCYDYVGSGIFTGVTVRKNVINEGNSFWGVPDVRTRGLVAGYQTNVNSTNCALMPV